MTAELRLIADGIIAAGLPLGGKPGTAARRRLQGAVVAAAARRSQRRLALATDASCRRGSTPGLTPTVETDYERWQPLHWVIEAPDVMVEHGGFDAVIGNPPFLGGKKISGAIGRERSRVARQRRRWRRSGER